MDWWSILDMKQTEIVLALSGAIFALAGTAGLHFWRFWLRTRDRLFIYFALAFWAFAIERSLLIWITVRAETHPAVYLVRLVSFLLIAGGIIDKNRAKRRS